MLAIGHGSIQHDSNSLLLILECLKPKHSGTKINATDMKGWSKCVFEVQVERVIRIDQSYISGHVEQNLGFNYFERHDNSRSSAKHIGVFG